MKTLFLAALLAMGGIDYKAVESNQMNVAVQPPAEQARSLFSDATITRWWHDPEGIHLTIVRDKPLKYPVDPSKWVGWTDAQGSPWLKRNLSAWEGEYWQSKEWRAWRFLSESDWREFRQAGHAGHKAPPTENHGVDQSKLTHAFVGGNVNSNSAAKQPCGQTHEGPCPGPRCPNNPLIPPIQPNFPINLDLDPLILGVIGVAAAGVITILLLLLIWGLRKLFR